MIKDGGIRLSEALLFDEIAESSGDTEVNNITLTRQTEVFAQSLEKKIPMFWRYKQSVNTGCVYVADALLLEQKTGYAVVSFLFENINESFMYPIVNAYCFMVLGMPYTGDAENISKEYLESVYGKNALGVQNDIFFPEICRCEDKYSLEVSWYSAQKEAVEESSDPLIRYYVRSQKEQIGEWNPNTKEAKAFAAVDNCLEEWTPQFCWMDEEQVRIPYTDITTEEYRAVLVQNLATVKGLGFIASSINISSFLSEESGADWIDFCNNLESVLGTEKQEITWLDRVSAQEAVYRISAYEVMEPHISYASDGIEIQIDCFTGRAYFYLHTGKEIKGVLHAEAAEIAEDLYMVTVTEETARIEFYQ